MVLLFQYGVSKQGIAGLMDMLMAQETASTESKFLSLYLRDKKIFYKGEHHGKRI